MKTALSILSEKDIQDFMTSRNISKEEAIRRLGKISLEPIAEAEILKTKEFLKKIGKL
jgi:hypothetical protein